MWGGEAVERHELELEGRYILRLGMHLIDCLQSLQRVAHNLYAVHRMVVLYLPARSGRPVQSDQSRQQRSSLTAAIVDD